MQTGAVAVVPIRLAVAVPSINVCAEPELRAMTPPGMELHSTRVPLTGTTGDHLGAAAAAADEAIGLLADTRPDVLVFHCTAATVWGGRAAAQDLERRLACRVDRPVAVTASTVVASLTALGARTVALVTPYDAALTAAEADFLREHGFAVPIAAALDVQPLHAYPLRDAREWHDTVAAEIVEDVDAVFVSCTNIRTAQAIAPLERTLGIPVVTSNQAVAWHACCATGMREGIDGYGQLLAGVREAA